MDDPIDPLPWMSNEDLDYYVSQFTKSGFRGPLNRYRNQHRDFKFLSPYEDKKILQPAAFIAGTLEPVLNFVPGVDLVANMRKKLEDLKITVGGSGKSLGTAFFATLTNETNKPIPYSQS